MTLRRVCESPMKDKKQRVAPAQPRTNFNSSKLVRFLADLAMPDSSAHTTPAFAQRLGQWVSFTDATALYAVLESGTAPATARSAPDGLVAKEALARVRAALVDAIQRGCTPALGAARIKFPVPPSDALPDLATAYAPFHHFYLALQREMEAKLGPLRTAVRQALQGASPALKQLAALDAALEKILSERERRLFGTVPVLLERRFEQWLKTHQQTLAANGQADDPATWMRPGAWLASFRDEMRSVLLAELEIRLEPSTGLVEALCNEANERG